MNTQDKIKALAELDGWECRETKQGWDSESQEYRDWTSWIGTNSIRSEPLPYLTDYNVVISLIVKVCKDDENRWMKFFDCLGYARRGKPYYFAMLEVIKLCFKSTPEQLCDALIKAARRWEE